MTHPEGSNVRDPEALFRAALESHRAGRLADAAAGYRQVCAQAPEHFPANLNLGVALRSLGRLEEALASYDRAVALKPDSVDAHNNRGNALMDLGRLDAAMASFERALALKPDYALAHLNRGKVLRDLKRPAEAVVSYDSALTFAPDLAAAHTARGVALYDLGQVAEALASYDRAIALAPALADAHRNRGVALRRLARPAEALESYDRALQLLPASAALHNNRGNVLRDLQRLEEALESLDRATALEPDNARFHNDRGGALFALDRPEAALEAYDRAIALQPDFARAHANRGVTLRRLNRPGEAVDSHDRAIALKPDLDDAHWHRSLCHLTMGAFAQGWRDYEHRWASARFLAEAASDVTPQIRERLDPAIGAQDLAGRNVLVAGEQGVGDTVMFASILPDLAATASSVSLVCDPRLLRLFAKSFPGVRLIRPAEAAAGLDEFDRVLAIGSLGRLFRNRPADFPGTPYLSTRPDVRARWAERLGPAEGRRRIGLSWRGGLARTGRSRRSLDLGELRPILDLPGGEFVSLQYGDNAQEVAGVNATLARPIRIFPPEAIDDFEDLAGLVQNLDLVITVQTTLVHLCGALGAPGLVLVPHNPEWRYGSADPTMPWYNSIRLFRQESEQQWSPAIGDVATETAKRLALPSPA